MLLLLSGSEDKIPENRVPLFSAQRPYAVHERVFSALMYESASGTGARPSVSLPISEHIGKVVVIPIEGLLSKSRGLFQAMFGGLALREISTLFKAAIADSAVSGVLLRIDSPGGAVDGVQELAREVFAARGSKPIVAYTDGMMTSAAYWVGAAADRIYISGDTTEVGSIGVVATHVDYSRSEAQQGIKTTEIVAGKYKRIASPHSPLTDSGRAAIQEMVDEIYAAFVADVATFRDRPVSIVNEKMAEGRVFIGAKAIKAGLVDDMSSLLPLASSLSVAPAVKRHQAIHSAASMQTDQPAKERTMQIAKGQLFNDLVTGKRKLPATVPYVAPSGISAAEPVAGFSDAEKRFAEHIDWPEYAALPAPVRKAMDNDFQTFLFVKQRGTLSSLIEGVRADQTKAIKEKALSDERIALETGLASLLTEDSTEGREYRAFVDSVQGNPRYPGLQRSTAASKTGR